LLHNKNFYFFLYAIFSLFFSPIWCLFFARVFPVFASVISVFASVAKQSRVIGISRRLDCFGPLEPRKDGGRQTMPGLPR